MHVMNWRLTFLLIPFSCAVNAADEGVIQKPELQFYIVPSATISKMEQESANASEYATPPGQWVITPSIGAKYHYDLPVKKAPANAIPFVTKPKNVAPCAPEKDAKDVKQHEPTYIKVFLK